MLIAALVLSTALPAQAQIHKLPAPDTSRDSSFGVTVSFDGDRALVGASGERVCGENSGAVYVFERDSETNNWAQTARLTPTNCRPGAFFGRALSLSDDRALVGSSTEFFATEEPNIAHLFERDSTGTWHEAAQLTIDPSESEGVFAAAVALDGDRALLTTRTDPSDPRGGAAYIFERDRTGQWHQTARLTSSNAEDTEGFGTAGALDGDRAVVAASSYLSKSPGAIYIFERDASGTWQEAAHFGGLDDFSISVAIDGNRVLVSEARAGRRQTGAATFFVRDETGTWRKSSTLHPPSPYEGGAFGTAVSLDGSRALVAGYNEQLGLDFNIDRVVYVFRCTAACDTPSATWKQQQVIDIGTVDFGTAIDHKGEVALIGHVPDDEAGAAYIVRLQ